MVTKEDILAVAALEDLKDVQQYYGGTMEEEIQKADRVGVQPAEMLKEYHTTAGLEMDKEISDKRFLFRGNLIEEEFNEVLKAMWPATTDKKGYLIKPDQQEILKELCDLVYVAIGTATTFGWDFEEAFRRVHENNMGRMYQEDGTIQRREDGKVMKNKNYPKVVLGDLV